MPIYDHPAPKYRDREDAGKALASRLIDYRNEDPIILAIPNGGAPVGAVIAKELGAELRLTIVRKLQIPDNPEAGFGALTSDGFLFLNRPLMDRLGLKKKDIANQKQKALTSIQLRLEYFGEHAEVPMLEGRTVIMVDDGLASGFTMEAAVESARSKGCDKVIIAVPTSSMSAHRRLESRADKIICPDLSRLPIFAVADAYENWYDLNEEEVLNILDSL